MAEYTIEYHAHNAYTDKVTEGIFEFNISPCNDQTQILVSHEIRNSLSESLYTYRNHFGFEINRVRAQKEFDDFKFAYKAVVQKRKVRLTSASVWSPEEEQQLLASKTFFIDYHLYLVKTSYTQLSNAHLKEIPRLKKDQTIFDYLVELNGYVHKSLTYQKNITDVYTRADEAMNLGKGVCQDYTHLFLAMARANRIPCRYISGYLNQGKKFLGTSFMHAWVEAFIPGLGWTGFDPTNHLLVDENFIKVSHGADYADCSPLKGVLRTNGEHKTSYQVKVAAQ